MSSADVKNTTTENGLASRIENLAVSSNGEQQPLPTSPRLTSVGKEGENAENLLAAAERSLLQKVIRKGLVENKNDLEINLFTLISVS